MLFRRPDEALLAINTFQKDLSDINPLVRAWALRAMSGIRVRVVLPLVVMAINKCARDPSPYVRRCAAHAIPKVYSLDHDQHIEALEEVCISSGSVPDCTFWMVKSIHISIENFNTFVLTSDLCGFLCNLVARVNGRMHSTTLSLCPCCSSRSY